MSLGADRDGRDPEALHLVAVDEKRVIGTCRVLVQGPLARLGRLAVEPDQRRRGIAAEILDAAGAVAREAGASEIDLHAQTYALPLYQAAGYAERGEEFVEEGIRHVAMRKPLA